MDKLIIKGMNPIKGEVSVSGAKNAVLPMLCASVMVSEGCVTIKMSHIFMMLPLLSDYLTKWE